MFNDFITMVSEAKYRLIKGERIKISPKQMLQRLPIVFAQIKVGNT